MKKVIILPILMLFMVIISCEERNRPPESNRLKPDHAPTPFSVDQIRMTCVEGYQLVHRIEVKDKGIYFQTTEFTQCTEDGTTMIDRYTDEDNNPQGDPIKATEKWKVLQAHASFPESKTTISRDQYTTLDMEFDCWLYIVVDEEKNEEKKFWFALNLPGPPVCFEQSINGELVYRMELLRIIKPSGGAYL